MTVWVWRIYIYILYMYDPYMYLKIPARILKRVLHETKEPQMSAKEPSLARRRQGA